MDAQMIEKLDRKRYRFMLIETIGLTCFMVGIILNDYLKLGGVAVNVILAIVGIFGIGLALTGSIKSIRLNRKIKADAKLNQALNNELFQLYKYKSMQWGFCTALFTAFIIWCFDRYHALDSSQACWLIIFASLVAVMISQVIYNRN